MEAALSKRLDAIEKKLDVLLKRTDPKGAENVGEELRKALAEEPRKPYVGLEVDLS